MHQDRNHAQSVLNAKEFYEKQYARKTNFMCLYFKIQLFCVLVGVAYSNVELHVYTALYSVFFYAYTCIFKLISLEFQIHRSTIVFIMNLSKSEFYYFSIFWSTLSLRMAIAKCMIKTIFKN